jgi:hypothetical protein
MFWNCVSQTSADAVHCMNGRRTRGPLSYRNIRLSPVKSVQLRFFHVIGENYMRIIIFSIHQFKVICFKQ